jgi:hypothetical protein
MTNFKKSLFGALALALLVVAPASAATTVGNTTFEQPGVTPCQNRLSIGLENVHKSTVAGVVTAFSVNPNVKQGSVAFKTTEYNTTTHVVKITGTSSLQQIKAVGLQTFLTRVRIKVGDYIGVWGTGSFACQSQTFLAFTGPSAYLDTSNPGVGFTSPVTSEVSNQRTLVSAKVEPDADNDGFGDETQDACKGQGGPNNGCVKKVCLVPQLKGLTKSKASSALAKGGCQLGKTKKKKLRKFTKKQKRNRVRSQSVKAGKVLDANATVDITINVKKKRR